MEPADVGEVDLGCVLTAGQGQNPARQAAVSATIPYSTPSMTINKVCGSGLRAAVLAAQSILSGDTACAAAGGMESMSNAPYLLKQHRWGAKMGPDVAVDELVVDGLVDAFHHYHMGVTAEILAEKYGIGRDAQDEYALQSHLKAAGATTAGRFETEIVPVTLPQKSGPIGFARDEHVRADATLEGLARLRPAFKSDGTVTAGNSSGINDGAAAVVLASEAFVAERGLRPTFRIVSWGSAGVEPEFMGLGPLPSTRKALDRAGLTLTDIGCVELNEAFAVQSIAVVRELGVDAGIVNVNGGAVALGHPIGASGARILVTLAHEMARRGCRYGLAVLCIGGGMGEAMIIERV